LSKTHRLRAEQELKEGKLKAMVATASMELGIDVGEVDLVCQMGTTRSISTMLQRIGRAGHGVGRTPKGRLFPLSRDELVEMTAILNAVRNDELDRLIIPEAPLDILAQHIVSCVAMEDWGEDELFNFVRRASPYSGLTRHDFDGVVAMLADGFSTRRGRRGAYIHQDAVNRRLRARKAARLVAVGNAGAIPENADYDVRLQTTQQKIGTLNEDFAIESMVGDVFRLGNASWQILKVEQGKVFVAHAGSLKPSIPFWLGEAPSRTAETSVAVSDLREEIAQRGMAGSREWLVKDLGLSDAAAVQLAEYLTAGKIALGAMPTQRRVIIERFFDESGGMQLVIHSPFGARMNRGWGLALRKKFCRRFNFELQAAATEDAIVLSLGETHSFPLEEVYQYLTSESVEDVLVQALLDSPMFETRWRWNANRSLAVPRWRAGKKVPPPIQRMNAEDLISVVFPDQIACLENIAGAREIPDHPLVKQTIEDCLFEAMDIDELRRVLDGIASGEIEALTADLTEPSPLAAEILTAGPYAFLDDAPLEERRTNAVRMRRWLSPEDAEDLGRLSPEAIDEVRAYAWPLVRDADEMHDALMSFGVLNASTEADPSGEPVRRRWSQWFDALVSDSRAVAWEHDGCTFWCAVERLPFVVPVHGAVAPAAEIPERFRADHDELEASIELVRGRLEMVGPTSEPAIASATGLTLTLVAQACASLEGEGFAMRGSFTGQGKSEWCERRLLARIHRATLQSLRKAVHPVGAAAFVRFLTSMHGVQAKDRLVGPNGVLEVIRRLEGFSAPVAAWEGHILPARVEDYDPSMLDMLCLSGRVAWRRAGSSGGNGPIRTTSILLAPRESVGFWVSEPDLTELSRGASAVLAALQEGGALFYDELKARSRLLGAQAEEALGELVARGAVVSDGFAGLRALVATSRAKRSVPIEAGGRWALVDTSEKASLADDDARLADRYGIDPRAFRVAQTLLSRWGVVFRAVIDRESGLPPWRDIHRVLRRMEARGEIRGGRFVDGFAGEQFAHADVIPALRKLRDSGKQTELITLSAADPLNVVGRILRGTKLPTRTSNRVLLRDGAAVAVLNSNKVVFLGDVADAERWALQQSLISVSTPPSVRRYLGVGSAIAPQVVS
jgi:ATP-dependent Lhr-like helicase